MGPGGRAGRPLLIAGIVALALGVALLALNLAGLAFMSLRSPAVEGYRDFAGVVTLPYATAVQRLGAIPDGDPLDMATRATRVIHEGMAHVDPNDRELIGLSSMRMTVPVWENYLLHFLAYIKPDTYRDYEFCDHRRSLARGAGRCGQQSLALVDFLAGRGLETGFVNLGGHTVATANVGDDQWILLDPDYGGVVPFDIGTAERDPASVIPYYWNDQIVRRSAWLLYGPEDNEVTLGGPAARWARACTIERAAYVLKWLLPAVLLLSGVLLLRRGRALAR